jgi:hypothetical protein
VKNLSAAAACIAALAAVSLTAQTAPTSSAPSAAPPAVSPAALPPAAAAGQDISNPSLRDELVAMHDEDQAGRKQLMEHSGDAQLRAKVLADDARHVARLREIVKQSGWPTRAMVGDKAGRAAWVIVQHGPNDLLAEMLPLMKAAAEKGDLSKGLVASSEDRALIDEGKKQLYGTQFDTRDGKFEPFPIDDPSHVDERRKSVGLATLAMYTEAMRKAYHISTPAAPAAVASTAASSDPAKAAQSASVAPAKQP